VPSGRVITSFRSLNPTNVIRRYRNVIEATFLQRTEFMRQTGTPVWIGEFGPIYAGDPERDARC
jgi:hypothetical protein